MASPADASQTRAIFFFQIHDAVMLLCINEPQIQNRDGKQVILIVTL
jgi:hypothetical protein